MSDAIRVITQGIGPSSSIDALILGELNPEAIIYTGILNITVKRQVTGSDVTREIGNTVKRNLGNVRVEFDD